MSRIYPANVFIDELGFVACGFDPSWLRDQGWRQWTPLPKISVPIYKPEMPGINSHPGLVDPWGVSMMSARSAVLRRRSCLESNPFQLSALREVESRCLDLTGLPGPEAAVPRLDPASSTCAKCSTASFQIRTCKFAGHRMRLQAGSSHPRHGATGRIRSNVAQVCTPIFIAQRADECRWRR